MIKEKTIQKEIVFFRYEEINSKAIDESITFVEKTPKAAGGKFSEGRTVLVSNIKIEISGWKPTSISIGVNINGSVVQYNLLPGKYYYFRGGEIMSVDKVEDVNFW